MLSDSLSGGLRSESTIASAYAIYREPLLRYVAEHVDYNTAEDIVQEVFLRLAQCDTHIEYVQAWLYKSARNLIFDRAKKHTPHLRRQFDFVPLAPEEGGVNAISAKERGAAVKIAVKTALNKLDTRRRFVLQASLRGLDNDTIAKRLGTTICAVNLLRKRAIHQLRKILTESTISS